LAEALRATKETIHTTTNQTREAGRGDTSGHPFPTFSVKAKMPQEIEEEL